MIQLANDPNTSRSGFRPEHEGDEAKGHAFDARRSRNGHAWPFPSRYAARPRQESAKPAASDSGS